MLKLPLLLLASTLWAGDLSGIWVGQIPARNGEMQDIAFKFRQNGARLGGKLYGDYRSHAITEGTVSGDLVTFVVLSQEQSGNQINESRLRFTGRLRDGALELMRDREGSTNAGNGGGVQIRVNSKDTLRLKRLSGQFVAKQ